MTDMTVGYFNWRLGAKGRVGPEKVLIDHHNMAVNSPNNQVKAEYERNLLQKIPLGVIEWRDTLADLAVKYPPPKVPDGA